MAPKVAPPIRCYECGHKLKDTDRECPLCGFKVKFKSESESESERKRTSPFTETIAWALAGPVIAGAVVAGVLVVAVVGNRNAEPEEKKRQTAESIRLTESTQRQRDAAPVTTAVVAGAGARTFAETCTHCHTKDYLPLDKFRLTKEQWKEAMGHMVKHGPDVPEAKLPDLLDYLVGMTPATPGPAKQ